jgi:hypothetical protein
MTATQSSITFSGTPLQTADATVTTIATIALTDERVYSIRANVLGMKSDGTHRHHAHIIGTFYRDGSTATQQGATTSLHTIDSGDGYAVTFAVSGNNALVQVAGKAATAVVWASEIVSFSAIYTA